MTQRNTSIPIDIKEALRYLGYHHIEPTPEVMEQLQICIQDIEAVMEPKSIYRTYPIEYIDDTHIVTASMDIQSKNLARNLKGCHEVACMAATLGIGVDRLIQRATILNMTKAAMYQAISAAFIETYCDQINEEIRTYASDNHLFIRPRFSCGYGDFALEHQNDFIRILQMPKTIGVTLTDSLLMMPSKSVTAIIGISHVDSHCLLQGCEACDKIDCEFRR